MILKNMKIKFLSLIALISIFAINLSAQTFYYEKEGIGPVKFNMNFKTLPESVASLYDSKTLLEEYDEMEDVYLYTIHFKLNGEDRFYARAYGYGDFEIYEIRTSTKELRTKSGAYNGMPAREFIQLPGVSCEVYSDMYIIDFLIDGVSVGIDYTGFSPAGQKKFDKAMQTEVAPKFVASDFNTDTVILLGGLNIW